MTYNAALVQSYGRNAYMRGEGPSDNIYEEGSKQHADWDRGYWQAHNEAVDAAAEAEQADYDMFAGEMSAVEQGYYDDDPNPYLGTGDDY